MPRVVWFLLPLLASGCSPATYLADRGRDFADCFQANAGVGLGLAANAKATDAFPLWAGCASNQKIGFHGRGIGLWEESEYGVLYMAFRLMSGPATDRVEVVRWFAWVESPDYPEESKKRSLDRFDLELGVTAGVVNARVGFSPGQLFDFLFGLAGLDLAGDDTLRAKEEEEPVPAPPAPAPE